MTYPHRPGAALPANLQTRWTVKRADSIAPAAPTPNRRYEVLSLNGAGEIVDEVMAAPATPAFESVFAAIARGTILNTEEGHVAVEDLLPGMKIETRDNGFQPLLWRGGTNIVPRRPDDQAGAALFRIPADTYGPMRPMPDLLLGPYARLLRRTPALRDFTGQDTALLPVDALADGFNVIPVTPASPVRVFHLGFARHQIIAANGLEIESMHPGPEVLGCLARDDLRRFVSLFPHIASQGGFGPLAVPRLTREECEALVAA